MAVIADRNLQRRTRSLDTSAALTDPPSSDSGQRPRRSGRHRRSRRRRLSGWHPDLGRPVAGVRGSARAALRVLPATLRRSLAPSRAGAERGRAAGPEL